MSSYATPTDLSNLALPAGALPAYLTTQVQQLHLDIASDTVDSYLGSRVTLPLVSVPPSIKMAVCRLAAYSLLVARGYNPDNGDDETMASLASQTTTWLKAIAAGDVLPPITDSGQPGQMGGPFVVQVTTAPSAAQASSGGFSQSLPQTGGSSVTIQAPRLRGW